MKVGGQHFRTIWLHPTNERVVQLIDQRFLPHRFVVEDVSTVEQMADAIREMHVRGAGLIGASAGYGMYLAAIEAAPGELTGLAVFLQKNSMRGSPRLPKDLKPPGRPQSIWHGRSSGSEPDWR